MSQVAGICLLVVGVPDDVADDGVFVCCCKLRRASFAASAIGGIVSGSPLVDERLADCGSESVPHLVDDSLVSEEVESSNAVAAVA